MGKKQLKNTTSLEREKIVEVQQPLEKFGDEYKFPRVPEGYQYLKGTWDTGFTIMKEDEDSEFVWIPVGFLEPDGTMDDGQNFDRRFGRRTFGDKDAEFTPAWCHEGPNNQEIYESVQKYGGLYISAYLASWINKKLFFKKEMKPFGRVEQAAARAYAENYEPEHPELKSCLPSGAIYDCLFKWIIQTGKKSFEEVCENSNSWSIPWEEKESNFNVALTGTTPNSCVFNIHDLAGNCEEWSDERCLKKGGISRGGYPEIGKKHYNVASKRLHHHKEYAFVDLSFRVALYLK